MITVRLHSQAGNVWALFQCSVCREVQKRPLREALMAPLACKRCGFELDIAEAVAEANHRDHRRIPAADPSPLPGAPGA
jgi:hypothetical protein